MVNFLFWNLNNKPLYDLVSSLVNAHEIDVLLLAECEDEGSVRAVLESSGQVGFNYHKSRAGLKKVKIFSRFSHDSVESVRDDSGATFRLLKIPNAMEVLLIGAHLPSKLYYSDADQAFAATALRGSIEYQEGLTGHQRTVLVGDLNMNPFEEGLTAAHTLHSTMSRSIALKESRKIQERDYRFFYNPMWGHFGDRLPSPPGTYYYDSGRPINLYWNMFDQVLVRPALLPYFPDESVTIPISAGGVPLLKSSGVPNDVLASDHLPLIFALDLTGGTNGYREFMG